MTTTQPPPSYKLFVGIDIAAASFAATWTTGGPRAERARTFPQTPDGFAALQCWLDTTNGAPQRAFDPAYRTGGTPSPTA